MKGRLTESVFQENEDIPVGLMCKHAHTPPTPPPLKIIRLSSVETYALPRVKQPASGNVLNDSGSSNWSSVTT